MSFSAYTITKYHEGLRRGSGESFIKKKVQPSSERQVSTEQNIRRMTKADQVGKRKTVLEVLFYTALLFSIFGGSILLLS